MTVAERFATHALSARFADLPAAAVHSVKVYVLDSLGVGIAGSSVEGGAGLLRVAAGWGEPTVAIWGRTARLSAPAAAFLNAWQMHNQEYDCLHEDAVVHAMATVLPAALAAAELRGGIGGTELIAAIAVGVDIAAGLGLAAQAGFRFFRPATAGGFGAVAAAGRLIGLDGAALEAAFAWQLAQVSGTMQAHSEGSPILPVQVAFNARAALHSCELATLGLPPHVRCSRDRMDTSLCSRAPSHWSQYSTVSAAIGASRNSATSRFPRAEPPMVASKASWRCKPSMASPQRMLTA